MFNQNDSITIAIPNSAQSSDQDFLSSLAQAQEQAHSEWQTSETEGQLAVDVLETETELIIVATMAGTKPENITVHLHNDFLTIRGFRESPVPQALNYFHQEAYWGKFSRTIVLPVDVNGDLVRSEYKNGVLAIHLPKRAASGSIPILVIEE